MGKLVVHDNKKVSFLTHIKALTAYVVDKDSGSYTHDYLVMHFDGSVFNVYQDVACEISLDLLNIWLENSGFRIVETDKLK